MTQPGPNPELLESLMTQSSAEDVQIALEFVGCYGDDVIRGRRIPEQAEKIIKGMSCITAAEVAQGWE